MNAVVELKPRKRLLEKDFRLREQAYRTWSAVLQEGQSFEDARDPDFWTNVAKGNERSLMPGDLVEVRTFDHTWFGVFYARKVMKGSALMALISLVPLVPAAVTEAAEAMPDVLVPKWDIATKTFSVVRKADKVTVATGFKLREDALAWVANHLQALAS